MSFSGDEYRMKAVRLEYVVDDMVELVEKQSQISSTQTAFEMLAELIVQRGEHRHALALGTLKKEFDELEENR